jgi:vitamin B12 transporter
VLVPPNLTGHNALQFFSSNLRWDFASSIHWHHQISGIESYNREFIDTRPPSVPPNRYKYNRAGFHEQSSYLQPKFGATAGYQYEVENGFPNAGHLRRNNQGGFLDFRWLPHSRAVLNFGARAEANGSFGTRAVPKAGASLAVRYGQGLWGDTRVRVFYGQGIKEPRFDQNYGTYVCFPGNPSLKPERSHTWNVGVDQKLASDRAKVSAEYFHNRFYDIISFGVLQPTPGCDFRGNFFNTDEARARGMNLSLETQPARWFTVVANYSLQDGRVLKAPNSFDPALNAGHRLIRRPLHSGSLTMNAVFRQLNVNLAGYFTGPRADSDFLSFTMAGSCFGPCLTRNPGYARFDLASSYTFPRGVTTYLRVTNLFDKQYQDVLGYPALGRDVRVGMSYRFGGRN